MATNKRVFTLRLSDEVFAKIGAQATRRKRPLTRPFLSLCGERSNAARKQSAAVLPSLAPHGVGRGCDW